MSAHERAAAIGRLAMHARESAAKLVVLRAELFRISEQLSHASGVVSGVRQDIEYGPNEVESAVGPIPAPEKILKTIAEFGAEKQRHLDLKAQLSKLGL